MIEDFKFGFYLHSTKEWIKGFFFIDAVLNNIERLSYIIVESIALQDFKLSFYLHSAKEWIKDKGFYFSDALLSSIARWPYIILENIMMKSFKLGFYLSSILRWIRDKDICTTISKAFWDIWIKIKKALEKKKKISFPARGIPNIGMTCFMNSVLQSLISLSSFVNYIIKMKPSSDLEDSLKSLVLALISEKSNIRHAVKNFKKSLEDEYPIYYGHEMHDQKQFLSDILDHLKNHHNEFVKKFLTTTKIVYTCNKCQNELIIDNDILWAGCKRSENKEESLQKFMKRQISNCISFDCDLCEEPEMYFETEKAEIKIADNLIVYLGEHENSCEETVYPPELKLSGKKYQLKSVCGGTYNHGIAYVIRENQWFCANDSQVNKIDSYLTDLSVILFYEAITK